MLCLHGRVKSGYKNSLFPIIGIFFSTARHKIDFFPHLQDRLLQIFCNWIKAYQCFLAHFWMGQ